MILTRAYGRKLARKGHGKKIGIVQGSHHCQDAHNYYVVFQRRDIDRIDHYLTHERTNDEGEIRLKTILLNDLKSGENVDYGPSMVE